MNVVVHCKIFLHYNTINNIWLIEFLNHVFLQNTGIWCHNLEEQQCHVQSYSAMLCELQCMTYTYSSLSLYIILLVEGNVTVNDRGFPNDVLVHFLKMQIYTHTHTHTQLILCICHLLVCLQRKISKLHCLVSPCLSVCPHVKLKNCWMIYMWFCTW
jgi:hypothetical protein